LLDVDAVVVEPLVGLEVVDVDPVEDEPVDVDVDPVDAVEFVPIASNPPTPPPPLDVAPSMNRGSLRTQTLQPSESCGPKCDLRSNLRLIQGLHDLKA
jgi:hypothetical protein